MVKKQVSNKLNEKDKLTSKSNKTTNKNKFSVNITSKMKKKLKYTQIKLKIDKTKLKKIISHLLKTEPPKEQDSNSVDDEKHNDSLNLKSGVGCSFYLYITLKKELSDAEKRTIKNKLLKIKYPMINDYIYICLIEDSLNLEQINEIKKMTDLKIDIISKNDFVNNIKTLKNNDINLDDQYQIFLTNSSNNLYLNKNSNFDVIYYQKFNYDLIKDIIKKIYEGASIIKLADKKNNILKIKFGYNVMNKDELVDNAFRLIYKSISFILSNCEKYNGIENIIIKSNKSIPFQLFGNIKPENIGDYNK